ncbi:MAG: hypothetical protein QM817_31260 [Archangium sp.]
MRAQTWREWSARVEALPPCLPQEWADAPSVASGESFEPGQTIHVRGQLGVLELDCSQMITEYRLVGRYLPSVDAELTLAEIEEEVARSTRVTCGSFLGLRGGSVELGIENPFEPRRVWRENDALLFDSLLAQTGVVIFGVIDAAQGSQALVRVDRVCRVPGPSLELHRLPPGGRKWKLLDGLEQLANDESLPPIRRDQSRRVLNDLRLPK